MNDRVSGFYKFALFIIGEAELRAGQIAAEDSDTRMKVVMETREIHVQLQTLPQPQFGFVLGLGPDQQIKRILVAIEKIGGDMSADVSGRAGQEYRHVAPSVPVLTASPLVGVNSKLRAGLASSGRPSIRG